MGRTPGTAEGDAVMEEEWLACTDPVKMYDMVKGRASIRQVRLLMVGCCRLKASAFSDPRIQLTLETAERCADDPAAEAVANALWDEYVTSPQPSFPQAGLAGEIGRAILGAWGMLREGWSGPSDDDIYRNAEDAILHAVFMCLRDGPKVVFSGGSGDAVQYCLRAVEQAWSLGDSEVNSGIVEGEEAKKASWMTAIAGIIRCLFNNPFRPIRPDPAWQTPNAVTLARTMYETRDFAAMPLLADLLEEAGCPAAVSEHCRGPGPHVRGCWVLDLLLGKS
jgi:hypothetical protein